MANYEQKYNKLVDAIKVLQETNPSDEGIQSWVHDNVPELAESEDERMRENLYKCLRYYVPEDIAEEYIAWLEKQGGQKQTWEPNAAQLIVIKDLIEDKNTSKVNKVILRGMLEEFKQFTSSQSSQFSSGNLLDSDKVIEWLKETLHASVDVIANFKKDFGV